VAKPTKGNHLQNWMRLADDNKTASRQDVTITIGSLTITLSNPGL
jgi:hypothetical protein